MKKVIYDVTEETYECDGKSRISYGIAAFAAPHEDGAGEVVATIHDVGINREKLVELVDSCNRLELSVVHLSDVVEDFLCI